MLDWLISWAERNESIQGLILSGSKANPNDKTDLLSDYDIAVVGSSFDFIENDSWLSSLTNYWVCVHDKFEMANLEIPTRLVIFNSELKVDFSFIPTEVITEIVNTKELPDGFKIGYQILLDKDSLLKDLPKPTGIGFVITKPTDAEYFKNQNEFWFEVYHVAKYLVRNDLWVVKFLDWSCKELLLQMLEWQHGSKCQWQFSPKPNGKNLRSWSDVKTWEALHSCFGLFSEDDAFRALENTMQLYRETAKEVGNSLSCDYNQELDKNVSGVVERLNKSRISNRVTK